MKKIIIIASVILICIIIILSLILRKKSTINNPANSPFSTSIPQQDSSKQIDPNLSNLSNQSNSQIDISTIEPVETLDFRVAYVPTLNKIVVEKKTPQAEELFYQWVNQNQLNEVINNQNKILFTNEKIIPTPSDSIHKLENKIKDFFQLMDDLNSIGQGANNNQSPVTNNPTPITNNQSPVTNNPSLTYYSQCGDLGSLPLPDGCTLCYAGCGPTTVSMIASSYLGKDYDPKTIVDLYKSKSYLLGCAGSRYSDAKQVLQSLGLKTTDYLVYNFETADQVVPDLKKYLDAGWTFFVLASFKESGGGHYFWITDIDNQDNILAYDPYYGRFEIPYNENGRYPYPLYRLAFGVKR